MICFSDLFCKFERLLLTPKSHVRVERACVLVDHCLGIRIAFGFLAFLGDSDFFDLFSPGLHICTGVYDPAAFSLW